MSDSGFGVYIYIYIYIYIYTHTHTHIYIYIYIYIHTHTHTYIYIYIHIYIKHVTVLCTHVYYIYTRVLAQVCVDFYNADGASTLKLDMDSACILKSFIHSDLI